ncbi:MAG: hypothetical protein JWR85_4034 [Marmoricola sp.]|nr:hypothetical protein [Marmoricola sp.]
MSYNWENIIWHNADNTWGIGFYERISHDGFYGGYDEDDSYDSEWDDDYDYDHFAYAANGFPSADAAKRWWTGVNPGGFQVSTQKLSVKESKEYADMVRAANDPAFAKELEAKKEKAASLAFVKSVREKLRANEPVANKAYNVRISLNAVPSATGMMQDHRVTLVKDGDWLGFENSTRLKNGNVRKSFVKVWNTKTRTQSKNIVWVEAVKALYGFGYRRY